MEPIFLNRKFDGPTMYFYGLHKQSKNNFGINLPKMEIWTHIFDEKADLVTIVGLLMDLHY